jgi:hypothetical protein
VRLIKVILSRCNGTVECLDESDEDDCAVCNDKTWTCADNQVNVMKVFYISKLNQK